MRLSDVVQVNRNYYWVDSCLTMDHGYETMIFPCDRNGNVTDWIDLYCENYRAEEEMAIRHVAIVEKMREMG